MFCACMSVTLDHGRAFPKLTSVLCANALTSLTTKHFPHTLSQPETSGIAQDV